jgi:hypothetical protein
MVDFARPAKLFNSQLKHQESRGNTPTWHHNSKSGFQSLKHYAKRGAKGKFQIYTCNLHKHVNLKTQPLELSKYIVLSFQLVVLQVTEFLI